MTLKCFESENYFAFLMNNRALAAHMHTDRHKQENSFFLWKMFVFTDPVTDSFWGRR